MNCRIKEFEAGKILAAEKIPYEPNFFETEYFEKEFGDWLNNEVVDPARVYEDGSPIITFNASKSNAFYLDANYIERPIFNVKFNTLPAEKRAEVSNGIVDQMVVRLFNTVLDFKTSDIDKVLDLRFDIYGWMDSTIEEYKGLGVTEEVENSLVSSKDDYIELLIGRLKSIGIDFVDVSELEEREAELGKDAVVQAPSFQRNTRDKASVRIKYLLHTLTNDLEDSEFIGKGKFALPQVIDASQVWAVLLPTLSNIPLLVGKNPVEQQLLKLNRAVEGYPWLQDLIDVVEDFDQQTQIEFFTAFNNIKNRLNVTEIAVSGVKQTFSTVNAENANSDFNFILKDWALDYRQDFFPGDIVDKEKRQELEDLAEKAIADLDTLYRTKTSDGDFEYRVFETSEIIAPLFEYIGMPMSEELLANSLYHWKDKVYSSNKKYTSNSEALTGYIGALENKIKGFLKVTPEDMRTNVNPYKTNFEEIAKAEEDIRADIGLHMATVGKNRVYLYSLPTMLQERLNELKSGTIDIDEMQKEFPWLRNSLFLNAWKNSSNTLKKTELGLRSVVQMKGRSRDAKDNKNISKGDYTRVDFFNILRLTKLEGREAVHAPIYNTQVPADKSREYQMSIDSFIEVDTLVEAVDGIYVPYVMDEVAEMVNARRDIKKAIEDSGGDFEEVISDPSNFIDILEKASQKLIMGYHLGKNGELFDEYGVFAGGAFTFRIFKKMNDLNLPLFKNGILTIDNIEHARDHITSNAVRETMRSSLHLEINNYLEVMDKAEIIVKKSKYSNKLVSTIDDTILKYYKDKTIASNPSLAKDTEQLSVAIKYKLARDYTINSINSKIEFAKIFTGSLQYYGKESNYIKRVPSTYIDGIQLMTGLTEDDHLFKQFTFATETMLNSELLDSNLSDSIKSYYTEVDRTDAQGYITPKRWKFIMERSGKFGKSQQEVYRKLRKQWNAIKKGKKIPVEAILFPEDIKILSAQPVKGVFFDNKPGEGPVYLKYSQAILIPSLAASFPKVKALLDYMEENNIDEAVAQTGVKVGAKKPMPLFTEEGDFINPSNDAVRILDNRNWRLQQDLPTKTIKETKIGVQIQKIIISRLAFLNKEVGDGMNGPELAKAIDIALQDLSNIGIRKFKSKYGMDENFYISDIDKFYAPLIRDLETKSNTSQKLIEALKSRMLLAALPQYSKTVVSTFMGKLKKAAVDLMTPGGAFIQMSDQLIGKAYIKSSGVKMLIDFDGLKPPMIAMEGKIIIVKPGQALIPHSLIVKYLPDYQNMTEEALRKAFPEELRNLIGYRIPTQSRASTDFIEIVGILPPEMGDTIITYGEITAKTGSDFDIDKLFFIMQEMVKTTKGIERAPEYKVKPRKIQEQYTHIDEISTDTVVDIEGVEGFIRPEIKVPIMTDKEVLFQKDATAAYVSNQELKTKVKDIDDLIKCIWG